MRYRLYATTAALALLSATTAHAQICTSPNCTAGASGVVDAATTKATGSTTQRALSARAADSVNLMDYGAVENGTTGDGVAANAAWTAAGENGTIYMPPGGFNFVGFTDSTPTAYPRLWKLSGNTYSNAGPTGLPVNFIGYDEVESFFNGGKYMGRENQGNASPTLRLDTETQPYATTDAPGGTNSTLVVNSTLDGPNSTYKYNYGGFWANLTQLRQGSVGLVQDVAVASLASHDAKILEDGYGPRAELWGENFVAQSFTGAPSTLDGSLVSGENDLYAGDDDPDNAGEARINLHMVLAKSYTTDHEMRGKFGALIGTGPGARVGRAFSTNGQFDTAAFDGSQATPYAISYTTTAAQSAVSATINLPITGGIQLGEIVTGTGIPTGDAVVAVTRETYANNDVQGAAPTAGGTVTLATAPTAVIPSGVALTFSTYAPVFQMSAGQRFCFDVNGSGQPLGKQCARYNAATGMTEWRDALLDTNPYLAFGKLGMTVNTGMTINDGFSVTGGVAFNSSPAFNSGFTSGGVSTFDNESDFSHGTFTDPESGVARDAKFGQDGIAWAGGAYGDTLTVTGATILSGGLNETGISVFNTEANFGGALTDAESGVARDIKANTNGIAFKGGLYGDTMQVLGGVVAPITASGTLVAANCGTTLRDVVTSANTVTVPTGLPVGCKIDIVQIGTDGTATDGLVTFAAGSGMTLEQLGTSATHKTTGQYARASLLIDTTSSFLITGQVQ